MRRRLSRHGPRPPRAARPAGGAADRLRRLPRRLTRQQRPEGGPQLRPDRQGHADGTGRPARGAGPRRAVLGVQPLRRPRGVPAASRAARRGPPQRPRQGAPGGERRGVRRLVHRRRPGPGAGPLVPQGRPQARAARRAAGPAARHRRHPADRAPGQPAAGRGGRGAARAEPDVHRPVPDRGADLGARAALRGDGRAGGADRLADRPPAGQSAARADHLLDAEQRPVPAPSAAAAGDLLRPALPRRPGAAAPVERHGGRDPRPRPGGRRRRRGGGGALRACCCGRTTRN